MAAIVRAQNAYIARLGSDPGFAAREAMHAYHARLGDWIVPEIGRKVLELGCGPGRYVAMLAALGFEVVGVDPYRFGAWADLEKAGNARLIEGVRAENLPFEDASFDHVCCLGALLYFDDPDVAMSEVFRVLKPGGRAVLRSVNKDNLYTRRTGRPLDPASKNLYSLREMEHLAERAGFNVRQCFQHGYYSPIFTDLYWYWVNVHATVEQTERWSERTPPQFRVNNILHIEKPR